MEAEWRTLGILALGWAVILHAAIRRKPLSPKDWIGAAGEDWDNWSPVGKFMVRLVLLLIAAVTVAEIVRLASRLL